MKSHETMSIPFNTTEHRTLMAKINESISESTDVILMFRFLPYVDQNMRSHSSNESAKWQQMTGIHEKEYNINSPINSEDMDNHQQKETTKRKKRVHWSSDIAKIYHIKRITY